MSIKDYHFPVVNNDGSIDAEQYSGDKNIRCNKLWASEIILNSNPIKSLLSGSIVRGVNEYVMINPAPTESDVYNILHNATQLINYTTNGQTFTTFKPLVKGYYKIDWSFMVQSINANNAYYFISKKNTGVPFVKLVNFECYLNQNNNPNVPTENYNLTYILEISSSNDLLADYSMSFETGATAYNIRISQSQFNVIYLGGLL